MSGAIQDLLETTHWLTKKIPRWTQGQGSNVSYKDGDKIWIKPSGLRLDELKTEKDLCVLNLPEVTKELHALHAESSNISESEVDVRYAEILKNSPRETPDRRPSMETGFHVFLKNKFVWHFHSLVGIFLANELAKPHHSEITKKIKRDFPFPFHLLTYVPPGGMLSMQLAEHSNQQVLLLANHGVILQGGTKDALRQWLEFEDRVVESYELRLPTVFENRPTPLRMVFPDLVVFGDRIQEHIVPKGNAFVLGEKAPLNVMEMWWANQWLLENVPDLPELSSEEQKKLPQMPTEVFRRQK